MVSKNQIVRAIATAPVSDEPRFISIGRFQLADDDLVGIVHELKDQGVVCSVWQVSNKGSIPEQHAHEILFRRHDQEALICA